MFNNAYFPMKQTRRNFFKRCKEIVSAAELTPEQKKKLVESAATALIEDTINKFPEIRSINEREMAVEDKYSGPNGIRYCPECGTWSPKEPLEISALANEWSKIKDRKIDELCRKVLSGKAA